ncbi:outer membrane protein [Dinoroseobacter sp. S375]|uniref:outer membrane protein n=1 Tax=Dinoroseobacter sp. S375 TaxID=3415136 RepID=UPI003C7E79EA
MAFSSLSCTVLTAALLTSFALPAVADGSFYIRGFGGVSMLSDTDLSGATPGDTGFDRGQILGGAIGYDYAGSPFRSEIEYTYRTGDADGGAGVRGDFASTTLAVNGYYDFAPRAGGRVTPYLGAGLAYITEVDFDVEGGNAPGEYNDTGNIGFQIMLGAAYALSEQWSVNGELRYFDAGRQDLSGPGGRLKADYQTVDLIIGTTFTF